MMADGLCLPVSATDVDLDNAVSAAHFLTVASRLAGAYLSGHTSPGTAAVVRDLFPGATSLSISLFVGGRLLVTEHNLLQAGYVDVSFDSIEQTVAGRAIASNSSYQADASSDRGYTDLARATSRTACDGLLAAPISQRQRRTSGDNGPAKLPGFTPRRNSFCSGTWPYHWASPRVETGSSGRPLGSLTLGMQASGQLLSSHLRNLTELAESLEPLLGKYCHPNSAQGLESLFCQPDLLADAFSRCSDSDSASDWNAASTVEDYVDTLINRQSCGATFLYEVLAGEPCHSVGGLAELRIAAALDDTAA
jgi:hypothetical protein